MDARKVTLLGDAAHPTMPTLAQGGNMAIEDGYVLARNLARHQDDAAAALRAYVAERLPRTSRVQLQARAQFANNRKVPPPPFLDRTWIFTFDATRESRLARGLEAATLGARVQPGRCWFWPRKRGKVAATAKAEIGSSRGVKVCPGRRRMP